MEQVNLQLSGMAMDFELARRLATILANQGHQEERSLIAWNDQGRNKHSPCCLQCEIKGEPGWEVYGRNHGGKLRVSINKDQYVFIFS